MELDNLLVIGLGLLGGSAALAARERKIARTVTAIARPGRNHDEAVNQGIIDRWGTDLQEEVSRADMILLAQPVDAIVAILPPVLDAAQPHALITDVGSTKGTIVAAAHNHKPRGKFIGSHPMAGSHLTGWKNSRGDLFDGATTYVTPTPASDKEATGRVTRFWQSLGSRPVIVDPTRHDHLCALLSHVPHLAAVALMELIEDSCEDPHFLRVVAGAGLRDTTRIAMGDSDIWREICQHNNEEISSKLERLGEICKDLAVAVRSNNDGLVASLKDAAKLRCALEPDTQKPT